MTPHVGIPARLLEHLTYGWPLADVLIIHLGGNVIGNLKTLNILFQIRSAIQELKSSRTVIAFLEIIPRLVWLQEDGFSVFDKVRKRINRRIEKFMSLGYGISFRHVDLAGGGLYQRDGIHLSDVGLDILNLNFQTIIEQAVGWGR